MADENITFQLINDLSELSVLQRHLESFATRTGLTSKSLFEINLAVDELFTNLVTCGCPEGRRHFVHITLTHDGGVVTIRLEDDGQPFNPLTALPPDVKCPPENRPVGGLGIHLAKTLTDRMTYRRDGGKNIVILTKIIRKDERDAAHS